MTRHSRKRGLPVTREEDQIVEIPPGTFHAR
jgi:hypothetical protein